VRAGRKATVARLATRGASGGAYRRQRRRGESRLGVVIKKRRRSKHERAMMNIKDKIDQNRGDRRVSHVVHRGEPPSP
jgi:hypothetical protein